MDVITETNLSILRSPIALLSICALISGLITRNFLILKFSFVHLIGNFLFESKYLMDSVYAPFILVAFALSYSKQTSSFTSKNPINPKNESKLLYIISIFLTFSLIKNCLKSVELSQGGFATLKLNDYLISESIICPGNGIIKAHISKSASSSGISKFSMVKNSKVNYEFGTNYDEQEMLQKFKYRVADINESVDPAYWRVKTVLKGRIGINDEKSRLQIKIMTRTQAD